MPAGACGEHRRDDEHVDPRAEQPGAVRQRHADGRRMMLTPTPHARTTMRLPIRAAPRNCAAAVISAPAAQAATSVVTVWSKRTTAAAVASSGNSCIAISVRLTRSTSPRAWAMAISKPEYVTSTVSAAVHTSAASATPLVRSATAMLSGSRTTAEPRAIAEVGAVEDPLFVAAVDEIRCEHRRARR